jgi:alanine racemase
VKDVGAGEAVGYMGTFVTKARSRIAVLPVGYADGYPRLLSNRARVIVGGEYAPVVGRVSMDLTIVDVSHIRGVAVGDEVILIGKLTGRLLEKSESSQLPKLPPSKTGNQPQIVLLKSRRDWPEALDSLSCRDFM